MNICTEFNDNTLSSYYKCELHGGVRGKATGSPKSLEFTLWGPRISQQNRLVILPIFVKIIQAGPT